MSQVTPSRQGTPNLPPEMTHHRTNMQSPFSPLPSSRAAAATPKSRSQSSFSPPHLTRAASVTPNTRTQSPVSLPHHSGPGAATPNPRYHHSGTTRKDKLAPSQPQYANPNRFHHSQTETDIPPPTHVSSRQSSRIPTRINADYSRGGKSDQVTRDVQLPLSISIPNHYHGTVQTQHDEQVDMSGCYDPSIDTDYSEPHSSRSRPGRSRERSETISRPSYRANMKYDARGVGSARGTAVNIAGCDLSAFTKMGVGVDDFLRAHEGMMRNMMMYGNDYEANTDAEGAGEFYNVAGVGYNPNGPGK
ncbi:hypothetical protein BDQ17DRAFT_1369498 [Cyathus striatus]|nr:hypothetical protein BDQ17DRAFT_1369498 [Cyathus striatus]